MSNNHCECNPGFLSTDSIKYDGPNTPCVNVRTCDTVTVAIQKIDEKICQIRESSFFLTTLGTNGPATYVDGILNIPQYTSFPGTVTYVNSLNITNSGTDISSSVADPTTTPTITLNIPTASSTARGVLNASDWTTFNNKENAIAAGLISQYWRGDKTWQTLNTSVVPEGINEYFTQARARSSVSAAGTGLTYDSLTGIFTWTNPGYTSNTGTVTSVTIATGTGISGGGTITTSGTITITNSAPDQVVTLSDGGNINISGTYPNFTLTNSITNNNQLTNGAGYITTISGIIAGGDLDGTYPNPTLKNASVTGQLISGVNITGGTILGTDSILIAFGKLQNQINGLIGGSIYQGLWNASTNTPTITSSVGTQGHYYIVSVAGSTNIDGITDWQIGDWIIFNGSTWGKVDNTDAVISVNGQAGIVNLTTSHISEGTNLYFTNARSRAALSFVAGSGAYNSSTGQITIPTDNSQIANGAGYITSAALSNYVTLTTNQTIGGIKTFSNDIIVNGITAGMGAGNISGNTAFGNQAIRLNTTGSNNSAFGSSALSTNTTGQTNTAIGAISLFSLDGGSFNAALGYNSMGGITTGSNNVAIGSSAGTLTNGGSSLTSANQSVLIGSGVRASASGNTNEIVIGFDARGNGSNTVTIGNSSVTDNYFSGNIRGGAFIKSGGTSSQFLKADGSVDGNSYATAASISGTTNYIPKFTSSSAIGNSQVFDNGTSVGIGTTTFDIFGRFDDSYLTYSKTGNIALNINAGAGSGRGAQIYMGQGAVRYLTISSNSNESNILTNNSSPLKLGSNDAARLTIGTSNITSTLPISGTSLSMSGGGSFVGNVTTQSSFIASTEAAYSNDYSIRRNSNALVFTGGTSGYFFNSSGNTATHLAISPSGNVGIGVTPSAWSSGGRIEIGNDKTIVAQGPSILLGANLYFNSGFKYVTTGASTFYYQTGGQHQWNTAPSGTAGNPVTFTQAMTLTANSELLVNTTTADGTNKLIVNGGIKGTSLSMSGLATVQRLLTIPYNSTAPSGAISDYNLGVSAGTYGLYTGVQGNGVAWMQVGRTDSNTPYDLLIQPNGGSILMAGASADGTNKLIVNGGVKGTNGTYSGTIFANSPYNNTVLTATDATNITNGFSLLGPASYWGIRTATDYSWNLDVYNSNSPITALKITNAGAATFSSSLNVATRVLAGSTSNTSNAFSGTNNSLTQATVYSYNENAAGWSIYSAKGINYFAGNTGINTNNPNTTLDVNGTTASSIFTNAYQYHGIKYLQSGLLSTFTINLATEFPQVLLIIGNTWGVIGKINIFRGGASETAMFSISRDTSGNWGTGVISLSSNAGGATLSSVTGSGSSISINLSTSAYVSVELTIMVR